MIKPSEACVLEFIPDSQVETCIVTKPKTEPIVKNVFKKMTACFLDMTTQFYGQF